MTSLTKTEKRVCNDITALVEQGNGGKIDLTAPISTYRYPEDSKNIII